jgi:hypothetical protein
MGRGGNFGGGGGNFGRGGNFGGRGKLYLLVLSMCVLGSVVKLSM